MGNVAQTTANTTFSNMLSQTNLGALRAHFSDDALVQPTLKALVEPFPASATPYERPDVEALLGVLFGNRAQSALTSREREMTITTVLAVNHRGQGPFLGIHLYWSLMLGWSPEQLSEQLFVISIYNGIDTLSASFNTFRALLTGLDTWTSANTDQPNNLKTEAIIGQIMTGFAGNKKLATGSAS